MVSPVPRSVRSQGRALSTNQFHLHLQLEFPYKIVPVLSAQFTTAPTGRAREMRNLPPELPPRPVKYKFGRFLSVCRSVLQGNDEGTSRRNQQPWKTFESIHIQLLSVKIHLLSLTFWPKRFDQFGEKIDEPFTHSNTFRLPNISTSSTVQFTVILRTIGRSNWRCRRIGHNVFLSTYLSSTCRSQKDRTNSGLCRVSGKCSSLSDT